MVIKARKSTKGKKKTAGPRRPTKSGAVRRGGLHKGPARKPRNGKEAVLQKPAPLSAKPEKVDRELSPVALAIANAGLDKKAEKVTVLDVRGLTSYADFFVIMTADSDRQASAIADHVEATMKASGVTKVGVEGYETGRWILVDYGDVVAHVMNRESREFYDLESLWADAPRFAVDG